MRPLFTADEVRLTDHGRAGLVHLKLQRTFAACIIYISHINNNCYPFLRPSNLLLVAQLLCNFLNETSLFQATR